MMAGSKNWASSMPTTSTSASCGKRRLAERFDVGDGAGVVGLGAVGGDGGAVVAEVDVGLEAGDALAGDAGALEAADELFGLAGEHGAGDDFEASGSGFVHESGWAFAGGLSLILTARAAAAAGGFLRRRES